MVLIVFTIQVTGINSAHNYAPFYFTFYLAMNAWLRLTGTLNLDATAIHAPDATSCVT